MNPKWVDEWLKFDMICGSITHYFIQLIWSDQYFDQLSLVFKMNFVKLNILNWFKGKSIFHQYNSMINGRID